MLKRLFQDHPRAVGETYWQHLLQAAGFATALAAAAGACLVHALVPGLCQRTGSRTVSALYDRMVVQRQPGVSRREAA